jgi:hypothetical protein
MGKAAWGWGMSRKKSKKFVQEQEIVWTTSVLQNTRSSTERSLLGIQSTELLE